MVLPYLEGINCGCYVEEVGLAGELSRYTVSNADLACFLSLRFVCVCRNVSFKKCRRSVKLEVRSNDWN